MTLSQAYRFKEEASTGKKWDSPSRYLGANVGKYRISPDKEHWYLSSDDYISNAVKNVELELGKAGKALSTKIISPMAPSYHPELDTTPTGTTTTELLSKFYRCASVGRRARTDRH